MTVERHRPKSFWRRAERWAVGMVMAVIAFTLEKAVLRSIRKGGKGGQEGQAATLTSKGGDVDL